MTTHRRTAGWALWLQWIAATTLAVPVAAVAIVASARLLGAQEFQGARDYALIGGVVGAAVGVAQWLVLRRYASLGGWGNVVVWMFSMVVVGAVGLAAGFAPTQTLSAVGVGFPRGLIGVVLLTFVLGALVGTLQWDVLRTRVPGSAWWVLANAVAAPAGLASGELVGGLGGVLVGVAVFSTIAGGVLVRLLGFAPVSWSTPR